MTSGRIQDRVLPGDASVMRVSAEGTDLREPASGPLLEEPGCGSASGPPPWLERSVATGRSTPSGSADVRAPRRRLADLGFTNVYGTDVTAERAITKFPDQNRTGLPPVDGRRLVYVNPQREVIAGVGGQVGSPLPQPLCGECKPPHARGNAGWCRPRVAAETTPCWPSTCRSSSSRTSTAPK